MAEFMQGIGQMARERGLTVSALRFYDGAGVLEVGLDPARLTALPESHTTVSACERLR